MTDRKKKDDIPIQIFVGKKPMKFVRRPPGGLPPQLQLLKKNIAATAAGTTDASNKEDSNIVNNTTDAPDIARNIVDKNANSDDDDLSDDLPIGIDTDNNVGDDDLSKFMYYRMELLSDLLITDSPILSHRLMNDMLDDDIYIHALCSFVTRRRHFPTDHQIHLPNSIKFQEELENRGDIYLPNRDVNDISDMDESLQYSYRVMALLCSDDSGIGSNSTRMTKELLRKHSGLIVLCMFDSFVESLIIYKKKNYKLKKNFKMKLKKHCIMKH